MSLLNYLEFPREYYGFWPRSLRGERTRVTGQGMLLGKLKGWGRVSLEREQYFQVTGKGTSGPGKVGVKGRSRAEADEGLQDPPLDGSTYSCSGWSATLF